MCISSYNAHATHIRAGEIIARSLPGGQGLRYEISLVGYTDTDSDFPFATGIMDFGDGTDPVRVEDTFRLVEQRLIADGVIVNRWSMVHTFPAPGREYIISYLEANRNADIINLENGNSVNTPFYIETSILLDPGLGSNNTPQMSVPPIDKGAVGSRFEHNPGAFDTEGDSIAYRMTVPKKDRGVFVDFYIDPNDPSFGGTQEDGSVPTLFILDQLLGDVMWNAPGTQGEYNIAFVIEEWRKVGGIWFNLSNITRDMQIIIEESTNDPPQLLLAKDTCIEAGSLLQAVIMADDPNGHDVAIEGFGGPFELVNSPATLDFFPSFQPVIASGNFSWQTNCSHVREQPYRAVFKATDAPPTNFGPALVDFETWRITVVAPAPVLTAATANPDRSIDLSWEPYAFCRDAAASIQVWRRVGSYSFEPGNCQVGIPENAGYELVGEVPVGETTFLDDNNGLGLDFGANYCYRLVATFPLPAGGSSYASNEICSIIEATAPVITHVSVLETSEDAGEVLVRWVPPYDLDSTLFEPPYGYEVLRASGFTGSEQLEQVSAVQTDTQFVDTGLNTLTGVYNYRIRLFDANQNLIDTSAVASVVKLGAVPGLDQIRLDWQAEVPWSNRIQRYPYHYVYRDQVETTDLDRLVLIDSVIITGGPFGYTDTGQFNNTPLSPEQRYCYAVTTQGSYDNDTLPEPLLNTSQQLCTELSDSLPPCAPIAFQIDNLMSCEEFLTISPCEASDFSNELSWSFPSDADCSEGGLSFNIYFSETGEDGPFTLLQGHVQGNSYTDANLPSFARCYRIAAVDPSGNESALSAPLCRDNCPYYEVPNVFTPQQDEFNEYFRAFDESNPDKCARFVRSVTFKVFNRWGGQVYENASGVENDIYINWDGRMENGELVSAGVYYYLAEVTYDVLREEESKQQIKGWIHIVH